MDLIHDILHQLKAPRLKGLTNRLPVRWQLLIDPLQKKNLIFGNDN